MPWMQCLFGRLPSYTETGSVPGSSGPRFVHHPFLQITSPSSEHFSSTCDCSILRSHGKLESLAVRHADAVIPQIFGSRPVSRDEGANVLDVLPVPIGSIRGDGG